MKSLKRSRPKSMVADNRLDSSHGNKLVERLLAALEPVTPLQRHKIERMEHLLRQEQTIQTAIDAMFEVCRSAALVPTATVLAELCPQASEAARTWALAQLQGHTPPELYGLDHTTLDRICLEIRERSHAVRNGEDLRDLMPYTASHFQGQFSEQSPLDFGWALWMVAAGLSNVLNHKQTKEPSTVDDLLIRIHLSDIQKNIKETGKRPEASPEQLSAGMAQDFKTLLDTHTLLKEASRVVDRYSEMAPKLQAAAQPEATALRSLQQSLRDTRAELRQGWQELERDLEQRSRW